MVRLRCHNGDPAKTGLVCLFEYRRASYGVLSGNTTVCHDAGASRPWRRASLHADAALSARSAMDVPRRLRLRACRYRNTRREAVTVQHHRARGAWSGGCTAHVQRGNHSQQRHDKSFDSLSHLTSAARRARLRRGGHFHRCANERFLHHWGAAALAFINGAIVIGMSLLTGYAGGVFRKVSVKGHRGGRHWTDGAGRPGGPAVWASPVSLRRGTSTVRQSARRW